MGKLLAGTASLALVVLVAATLAGAFATAATPLVPLDGEQLTTSYPLFRWRLPSVELAHGVFVARSPETTLAGGFPTGNLAASRLLAAGDTSWRPTQALPAGRYWWLVETRDRFTLAPRNSAPSAFTIRLALRVVGIARQRMSPPSVVVRWTANAARVRVTLQMVSAGRVVWTAARNIAHHPLGQVVATRFPVPPAFAGAFERSTFRAAVSARF
jgi:hypothetical protein